MKKESIQRKLTRVLAALCLLLIPAIGMADKDKPGGKNPKGNPLPSPTAAGCSPTTAQNDLDINNVRTTILVASDMWWDLNNAKYEIPINSNKHSLFAGALWIGGLDQSGQILTAAMTYRQTGNDFWGGPIDTSNATINSTKCAAYDKHFIITKEEVQDFIEDPGSATKVIKEWPGNGNSASNEGFYLAPFEDVNGDGLYNYLDGDYPRYLISPNEYPSDTIPNTAYEKTACQEYLFGDKTLWWVFNDVGDNHSESLSQPIGLEVRAQAFGFKSNDEINNMTFYQYQIINRSKSRLDNTYFGQWVDPDLGNAVDDYVGCDVARGLGYCYNGDADDDGADGYGLNPPAVGVDFFQGPRADLGDGVDNDRDGCTDCTYFIDNNNDTAIVSDSIVPELIIMSKFVYYNNVNGTPNGNPDGFNDFYNYLQGIWLDGQPITYGGDGRDPNNPVCNFMFPGDTDPGFPGQPWTEVTAGNQPEDRRFLQTAGPFTLDAGAVNYITTGVVWARAESGGPEASVDLARLADDKAQALFDNCFKLLDGPDAPDLVIRELDKGIIISLENTDVTNVERYAQLDPTITNYTIDTVSLPVPDSLKFYHFQGYQVYQLANGEVTTSELKNPDKARLLLQCDIRDGVSQLVNFYFDPALNAAVPVQEVKGNNDGIVHTIKVTKDLFSTGATDLVNHKTYFYTAISYAYNEYKKYDPNDPNGLDGQQKPYKAGRNNIKTYTAIPHAPEVEWNGQILNAGYGDGPVMTRWEGKGNGGMTLDLSNQTRNEILANGISYNPKYMASHGPLNVKVYDPTLVINGNYEVRFNGVDDDSKWFIREFNNTILDSANREIGYENEQVMKRTNPDDPTQDYSWGFSMTVKPVIEAGKEGADNNAFLEGTIEYGDNSQRWLSSIRDQDGPVPENWIRSGTSTTTPTDYYDPLTGLPLDAEQVYEGVVDGTWGPYKLTTKDQPAPVKFAGVIETQIALSPVVSPSTNTGINSVDIYFTTDKSKWTRSLVVETGTNAIQTIGGAKTFDPRRSASIDKNGQPGDNSILSMGMGWFPGYAINLETGERLNIVYGENSDTTLQQSWTNGGDMIWNPTSKLDSINTQTIPFERIPVFGGMHYIYVFGHNRDIPGSDVPAYDSCRFIATMLDSAAKTNSSIIRRNVWKDAMWASIPMLTEGKQLLATDVHVRLRVARKYRPLAGSPVLRNNDALSIGTTYYVASTPVAYGGTNYTEVGASFVAAGPATTFTGNGTVTATAPKNGFMPMYTFNTSGMEPVRNDEETAKSALDLINVVPNPYYAYSAYEGRAGVNGQLDNRIKIVNLPNRCTVTIFTTNGTLIRKFNRDAANDKSSGGDVRDLENPNLETSVDWDLKNHRGIMVASGLYLIHVEAPDLGERTLKWFGILRPIDLDTF